MIFTGADATGFEEDARLTAMWLWTLKTGDANGAQTATLKTDSRRRRGRRRQEGRQAASFSNSMPPAKIAQGLGAHLEDLQQPGGSRAGETARLLPVAERTKSLLRQARGARPQPPGQARSRPQMDLFDAGSAGSRSGDRVAAKPKHRTCRRDRPRPHPPEHDSLCRRPRRSSEAFPGRRRRRPGPALLAPGPGALRALSGHTEEKRWVDGVLARKKGLGF